jgi:hypothetical protein
MTIYRVRARGLYNAADRFSFGYLLNSTAAESTVASTFTSAITTLWTTATNGYANYTFTDVALVDTVVYTVNASLRALSKTTTANAHAGTSGTASLAYGTAVTVAMIGAADTKSDRGHMSLPTPVQSTVALGLYTAAFQASLKLVLDPFFTTMRGLAGYSAIKVNPKANKLGDPPFTQHIVTSYSMSNKPGSARMRTRKQQPTAFVNGTI